MIEKDNFDILRKMPVFSTLKDEDLQKISDITIERNLRKGTVIFMEGDPGEAFYFIKSGKVKVYRTAMDGRELILTILSAGDVFAEVALFNDILYPASAEVLEDASIGMIRNVDLESLIRSNAEIALQIIKVFSKKLYDSQQKVKELFLVNTYARIAQILIQLAHKYGVQTTEGIELKISISRQELASMAGTARETISRALSRFKEEGLISMHGRKIIVKDIKKLKSWLE